MEKEEYNAELAALTDRKLLEELVMNSRALLSLANSFVESVEKNPLFSKMGSMFGKFGGR